ncbi:MAG TPA: hypothetical protein VHG72_15980 [Polyangia bacterium]|nr:hypothetical protein [Polyangia bacterium]
MKRLSSTSCLLLAATALAALPACESGFDRNDQIVNSLRILGIRSHVVENTDTTDWADAQVGDTLELSALVTNPANVGVTITWLACVPNGTDVLPPCNDANLLKNPVSLIGMANDPSTGVLNLGTTNPVQFTVPSEVQPLLDAVLTRAYDPNNPQAANPQAECSLFVEVPLIVILQGSDGEVFTATQNVRLSPWSQVGANATVPQYQYYIRNANPSITGFFDNPPSRTVCAGQPLTVVCQSDADCAAFSAGTTCQPNGFCAPGTFPDGNQTICLALDMPQDYYDCGLSGPELDNDPDGSPNVAEQPSITWYATAGSIGTIARPKAGTGTDLASETYSAFTRATGPFTIYGVVRDGRGGETWLAQDFQ